MTLWLALKSAVLYATSCGCMTQKKQLKHLNVVISFVASQTIPQAGPLDQSIAHGGLLV